MKNSDQHSKHSSKYWDYKNFIPCFWTHSSQHSTVNSRHSRDHLINIPKVGVGPLEPGYHQEPRACHLQTSTAFDRPRNVRYVEWNVWNVWKYFIRCFWPHSSQHSKHSRDPLVSIPGVKVPRGPWPGGRGTGPEVPGALASLSGTLLTKFQSTFQTFLRFH